MVHMGTYSLADYSWESRLQTDFNPYETYKTRLVRVDQAYRGGSREVIQYALRKCLRAFWFFIRRNGIGKKVPGRYARASTLESISENPIRT